MHQRLRRLCNNLWWCWDAEATALFASLDPERWEELGHNPIALLEELSNEELSERVGDRLERVEGRFHAYMEEADTWASRELGELGGPVAYFSMEFALHESLPIYSGGLGVLAGDHMKSASDLGIPFVGVGILYRQGYFKQLIAFNEQVPAWPKTPLGLTPLRLLDPIVEVPDGADTFRARIWELDVGRARLLLLDSDVPGNLPEQRALSQQLYGGEEDTRIAQEILLGIGGLRALRAVGLHPSVIHMNEGHSAFVVLERWREELAAGHPREVAFARAREHNLFTTHTPVEAGHDRFGWDLVRPALAGMWQEMGLPEGAFMDLGRVHPGNVEEPLCMTVLALRGSRAANGVSRLHGEVSRHMWRSLWPSLPEGRVPIGHVTNGVHAPSWMHPSVAELLDRASPGWRDGVVPTLAAVGDHELWSLRGSLRAALVHWCRAALGRGWLEEDALTIGFARRFAPYKRGNLLFTDPSRFERLLHDAGRPLQVLFAGKAHPRDEAGQNIVREVIRWTRDPRFRGRVVFLPDYDIALGRRLVQGVDLWLNTPRRPREASGTSGMKVPLNLGINCSILDGWWPEAWDGQNGWAIGEGLEASSGEEQDANDAESLYRLLEEEIVPAFWDRDDAGIPRAWVQRMRRSLETCFREFHTHRMVGEYARRYYLRGAGG